jgi:hypothetical protein
MSASKQYAQVVEVLDGNNVVLNIGREYGLTGSERFVIFGTGRNIKDIDGSDLGTLELFKGYGRVVHVQERLCILRSHDEPSGFTADFVSAMSVRNALTASLGDDPTLVRRGDLARPV